MTKSSERQVEKYRLDIGGEKGNAYYLLAVVDKSFRNDAELCKKILDEMRSGDYENLLRVFKKYLPGVELVAEFKLNGVDPELYTNVGREFRYL